MFRKKKVFKDKKLIENIQKKVGIMISKIGKELMSSEDVYNYLQKKFSNKEKAIIICSIVDESIGEMKKVAKDVPKENENQKVFKNSHNMYG